MSKGMAGPVVGPRPQEQLEQPVPGPDHARVGSFPGPSGPEGFLPGRCHMVPRQWHPL